MLASNVVDRRSAGPPP